LSHIREVTIIGAGPAGAYCAFELAKKGIYADIFDHSHPREKPCGGGISASVLEKFPFLERFRSKGGSPGALKIISCTGNQTAILGNQKGFYLSRQFLDEQILNMAVEKGARLIKEKVLAIQRKQNLWQIKTEKKVVETKVLVGADGVNSLVRRKTVGRIPNDNLALTYGYFVTGTEKELMTIKFVAEFPGYIWLFPRGDHSSIGTGSELKYGSLLKPVLDVFICNYPQIKIKAKFSAMLPSAADPEFFSLPCAGNNWVLVGDAAGHADPLAGEGIQYALWSGKLAAETLVNSELTLYDRLWREQYGNYFRENCSQKKFYYNPVRIEFWTAKQSMLSNLTKKGV
jgi:geranylgeranyl reductase family protein